MFYQMQVFSNKQYKKVMFFKISLILWSLVLYSIRYGLNVLILTSKILEELKSLLEKCERLWLGISAKFLVDF